MTVQETAFPQIIPPGLTETELDTSLQDPAGDKDWSQEDLAEMDAQHSWHPFTPMKHYLQADPLMIVEGKDVFLKDSEGRWYYDGCSSIWLNVHGHRHPVLDKAIKDQLDKIAHCTLLGQANLPATVLAKKLIEVVPEGLKRVHFSDCGASAVEIAIKTSIQYWHNQGKSEKKIIVGFKDNYHGDTLGAMAVAPSPLFHKPFLSMLPENHQLPFPVCPDQPLIGPNDRCEDSLGDPLRHYLAKNADRVAAVIVEPVEGAGGILPAPGGFLKLLREICDQYQVHLIIDEVATGFGHTGDLFACTAENVTPDILCLGKGLSGGYLPVSATVSTEKIFNAFLGEISERKTLYHGHSFAGNPLGCAVSLASLKLTVPLVKSLRSKTEILRNELIQLADYPCVLEVRQRGLMVGITIGDNQKNHFEKPAEKGYEVAAIARKFGVVLRPIGDTIILMPPPCIEEHQLIDLAKRFVATFAQFQTNLEAS